MEDLILLGNGNMETGSILTEFNKVEFFSDLEDHEIKQIAEYSNAYRVETGSTIFKEGSTTPNLCVITEGEVAIFKKVSPFESIKVADIKAGGIIGEMGIIDGEPISASAIASQDSTVIIISDENFKKLIKSDSVMGVKLYQKISDNRWQVKAHNRTTCRPVYVKNKPKNKRIK